MKRLISIGFIILLISAGLLNAQWQWLPRAKRLDIGDFPGSSSSHSPQISSSGNHVYVVWEDRRNSFSDIYFNYSHDGGATWQPSDIRLDTGDLPGDSGSTSPQISSCGNHVYVVWEDYRNGRSDIYFNYSHDGGVTWLATAIRVDEDVLGSSFSWHPKITSNGNCIYVTWQDSRNGFPKDIYFNYSHDGGATWQSSNIRLDAGSLPSSSWSENPQISSSGDHVYVVWEDFRNGRPDIYFNYSHDGGATWQASDIRLDIGDMPGHSISKVPQISSNGDQVYVVWSDYRNIRNDIFFSYSHDGGVTWKASDIRLDTGDFKGNSHSWAPQISNHKDHVYIVWNDDRNGLTDIYFNYSHNSGTTWQTPDIRLDTGSLLGTAYPSHPQICSAANHIYVVWEDSRNGRFYDIYFNYSQDGGVTWLSSDVMVNLDYNLDGLFHSAESPQITCFDNRAYVVWVATLMGREDIFFSTTNQSPQVRLGGDQTTTKGENVLLDGSLSWDPEDDQLIYNWRILSSPEGSHAMFSDRRSISPLFTPDKVGTYELRLVVTDAFGADGYDKIKVKAVHPAFTLTTRSGAGGTIRPVPGIHSYKQGRKVKLRAQPKAGFVFSHWSGDASGKKNPKTITMYRDKKIKAHFIRE